MVSQLVHLEPMTRKFRATLEPDRTRLKWVIVRVPFDPAKVWKDKKSRRVQGTINGFPFQTSLFGSARDGYLLLINKEMQKQGGVVVGGVAEFTLEPDLGERKAVVPPELEKFLKQDRIFKKWYQGFSYSWRKEIGSWISEPKAAEGRVRRAEQMTERMMLAMEGEHEVPPILQAAFRRQPQARVGWDAMTQVQRRSHLMGIFGYQSPESREKRAGKAVAEAWKIARQSLKQQCSAGILPPGRQRYAVLGNATKETIYGI